MASRQEGATVVIRRARELAVAGCDPTTIEALLAAEGYAETSLLITDSFAEELKGLATEARKRPPNTSKT
jgi:hypothetical protein